MANKSHKDEEPVGWVTVKGKHFPKWKDGTIGWQDGEEDKKDDWKYTYDWSKSIKTKEQAIAMLEGQHPGDSHDVETWINFTNKVVDLQHMFGLTKAEVSKILRKNN